MDDGELESNLIELHATTFLMFDNFRFIINPRCLLLYDGRVRFFY